MGHLTAVSACPPVFGPEPVLPPGPACFRRAAAAAASAGCGMIGVVFIGFQRRRR